MVSGRSLGKMRQSEILTIVVFCRVVGGEYFVLNSGIFVFGDCYLNLPSEQRHAAVVNIII